MGPHKMSQFLIKQEFRPEIVPGDMICKYPVGITREQELSLEKHSDGKPDWGVKLDPRPRTSLRRFQQEGGLGWGFQHRTLHPGATPCSHSSFSDK